MIRKLFLIWGAEDGDDEGNGDDQSGIPGSGQEAPETRVITTDELEAMTARSADRATRKAKKELASSLGFESLTELNEYVSAQKKAEEAAQDEQTKALQEAERAKKEYEAQISNLADQRLALSIDRAVIGAGIGDPKRAARIAALVRDDLESDVLEDEEGWEEAITAALQAVKADMPEMFAKSGFGSGDGGSKGKSTDDDDGAEKEKQLVGHYQQKGMVEYPT